MFMSPYIAKVKFKYPTLPSPQSQDFMKKTEIKSENVLCGLNRLLKMKRYRVQVCNV